MARRKVVVTGAAGYVAGRMLPALRERYDLTLLDVTTRTRDGLEVAGVAVADLTDPNRDAYRHHFRGADAVIHCAFVRAGSPEDRYWAERTNVDMAYNGYQVSLEEGVRRVVVCSSNHAADYYERLIWADRWDVVTPETRPLSDNFYGWAKESYEHLGFVFATGAERDGRRLENVQIRIGGPRETDIDHCDAGDLKKLRRALGAYLSVRDQVQLFVKSIEAPDIRDANGVPFQIFYGISGNSHRFWSIANARRVIGYAPEDDSQVRWAEKLAAILEDAHERTQPAGQ
ncbi:MAG: NAD-dependent epimerase/dehydratase family protein [Chloroflexi bacterium]|nr:NAD-dependent epimerase/dehydratase family protein [Chloroflexota bacterium]